jgi:hypothetical protein
VVIDVIGKEGPDLSHRLFLRLWRKKMALAGEVDALNERWKIFRCSSAGSFTWKERVV